MRDQAAEFYLGMAEKRKKWTDSKSMSDIDTQWVLGMSGAMLAYDMETEGARATRAEASARCYGGGDGGAVAGTWGTCARGAIAVRRGFIRAARSVSLMLRSMPRPSATSS